jgi:hemerythrin-like domain-containing protein
MRTITESLRRDHREIEQLLDILEDECDVFRRGEQPDYELLMELGDYFDLFVNQYYYAKEDLLLERQRKLNDPCMSFVTDVSAKRAKTTSSLQALGAILRAILNDQTVFRETFEDAAHSFIRHERRRIEIEEQKLRPIAQMALRPTEWAHLQVRLADKNKSVEIAHSKERLRERRRWIIREGLAG